ncbi:MAG: DUF86 domain-containing protein [Nitrospinae bacterium]|nr:DUF86 domain-containing protein [Nitrospinota bacterium]
MRGNRLYLDDIIQGAGDIERFIKGKGESAFLADEILMSAVLQKLIVIGEAAARVSTTLKQRSPGVEWEDIIAFRNIAVHAYFAVDWRIVWNAAALDAPDLKRKVGKIV